MTSPERIHRIKYFLKFFSRIPSAQWCHGTYLNCKGQRCAAGHLGMGFGPGIPDEVAELNRLLQPIINKDFPADKRSARFVTWVNDGSRYGPTPKKRILNVLKERLAMEVNDESGNRP